jgi:hypothetical protein
VSHDEIKHVEVDDGIDDQSFICQTVEKEAGNELNDDELTTAAGGACK